MQLYIPEEIANLIAGEDYSIDDVGMSESTVILLKDKVLKIQPDNEETQNEHRMMEWLQDKLPVPKVHCFVQEGDKNYLLMSRMQGKMSCDEEYMEEPERLVTGFIDIGKTGIADKWQDIALCYRSLSHNYLGVYSGKVYADFDPDILFEKLGIEPDWEKIRYYILMDELF